VRASLRTSCGHVAEHRIGLPTFGWHRLRDAFATNYIRQCGDIVRLSTMLGHTQITTTRVKPTQAARSRICLRTVRISSTWLDESTLSGAGSRNVAKPQ